jgi:hypothetical protein
MNPDNTETLDQALESTVVSSWADLTHGVQDELIHIEYGFVPKGTLDHLQVWSSISRGRWLLVCEYWMSATAFHNTGVRFENDYKSEGLARSLEFVMQHQNLFVLPVNHGRQGLLQISTPTLVESAAATASMKDAFALKGTTPAEPVAA